ncbi:unnamed protein product [Miscanthus lutarioriparius]|uniref:AP2/ERF domain-containing protein n=1 Tax=Miscanthus lutarioriparius TaxID=422564 RepID=A0A811SML1_9POAL|nr:unnamed protein product [Miscanthus lutarioriparius]
MDMGRLELSPSSSSSTSASSSSSDHNKKAPPSAPAKRTKFRETRHPVFRGVRRRGAAGRWVCEVRVPGNRGARLWLGTYVAAESAERAHDAAMLARTPRGCSPCRRRPRSRSSRTSSSDSRPPPLPDIVSGSAATSLEQVPGKADEPAALDVEAFEPDWFGDMDLDTYYASLAEGLLMEPPAAAAAWEHGDFGDGGADVALWRY